MGYTFIANSTECNDHGPRWLINTILIQNCKGITFLILYISLNHEGILPKVTVFQSFEKSNLREKFNPSSWHLASTTPYETVP